MRIFKAYKNKILPFLAKKANIMTLEEKQKQLQTLLAKEAKKTSRLSVSS